MFIILNWAGWISGRVRAAWREFWAKPQADLPASLRVPLNAGSYFICATLLLGRPGLDWAFMSLWFASMYLAVAWFQRGRYFRSRELVIIGVVMIWAFQSMHPVLPPGVYIMNALTGGMMIGSSLLFGSSDRIVAPCPTCSGTPGCPQCLGLGRIGLKRF